MNGCHVALVGRVTRPGELKHSQNGNAYLRVGVMVDDQKRPEDQPPEFADVTIWGELAEARTLAAEMRELAERTSSLDGKMLSANLLAFLVSVMDEAYEQGAELARQAALD